MIKVSVILKSFSDQCFSDQSFYDQSFCDQSFSDQSVYDQSSCDRYMSTMESSPMLTVHIKAENHWISFVVLDATASMTIRRGIL